ncbi:tripartite tricarboxylate transporter substrate binding protein [Bradyrhizobium sp. Tv2a-2]|uniref:tripartite tricarboxylate transporter substrate binding protein n=1 Tax=Bradyrhizobium sp. Tv2a-2 TaxID=113395 RepID=UPI0004046937|nr:tripartite tricarboxylate transporter substrate binding protein [Bradyrhizobium sp. Tv2a-2]
MRRRDVFTLFGGLAALGAMPRSFADAYPARAVRIIAGFAAGGGVDITARLIGQWLSDRLGQPFVVENRTGADGNIATEAAIKADADGYTLLLATLPNAVNATLYPHLKFDFLRDSAPVAGVIRVPMVALVHPSLEVADVPALIAYAKANPGKINMASAGTGSAPHMAGELFCAMAGVAMMHVPYRGQSPALADLLGGQVQLLFAAAPGTADYVRTGQLKALAVTSPTSAEVLKELPLVASSLPGYEASQWYGIAAPLKTPTEIVERLNREINAAFADNTMQSRFAAISGDALPGSPAAFGKLVADETEKWAKVVKFAQLKVE